MSKEIYDMLAETSMDRYQKGCNFIVKVGYRYHYFMCADEALEFAFSAYFSTDDEVTIEIIEALNNVKFKDSTQVDKESEEKDNECL